ncbi:MAG: protein kinase [Verrucomicrobiales bacterium]|nr:protein kinase [Verrucomicrobiales bacterium]
MPGDKGNSDINPDEEPDQTQPLGHEMPQPDPVEVFKEMIGQPGAPPTPPGNGWQALSPEELDQLLPDYTVIQMLGRGGMGAVYKAIQNSLDRPVAIKILPGEFCEDIEFEVRFRREAKAMARLNHPNIIQIHDFGQTTGHHFFFVMEFVDGADLLKMIKSGHVDQDSALKVVIQVCEALQYAHDHGYVHRDIKPANILLNSEGVVKVGDFGIAKLIDPELGTDTEQNGLTVTGYSMGTPHYVAPEQMSGDQVDHRADIYSLGVMFYEMLTGEIPRGAFDPPSGKIQVDVRIDDVVLKAMHEKPERRYQTAKAVETDVEIIRTDPRGQTMARMEKNGTKAKGGKLKKGWVTALLCLLVIGLVVGGMVWKPWEEIVSVSSSPEIAPFQPPGIKIPPALAAMKQQGGNLRVWSSPLAEKPINSAGRARGISDFVSVSLTTQRWLALRRNGTVKVSDSRQSQKFESLTDVTKIKSGGGYFALQKNGILVEEITNPGGSEVNRPFPNGVANFDVSYDTGAFILTSGKVEFRTWADPNLEEVFPKWRETINQRSDNVAAALHEGGFGSILRADGTFLRFVPNGNVVTTPEFQDIAKVARGAHWLALRKDGRVFSDHWENAKAEATVPSDLGKAFDVKAASEISAAQMEDGSWVAWGDNSLGVIDKINSIGPAVDIDFNAKSGHVIWIEPVVDPEKNLELTAPIIELPPALAAMKQRGGRLKTWAESGVKTFDLTEAETLDDFVKVAITDPGTREWGAVRVDGAFSGQGSSIGKLIYLGRAGKTTIEEALRDVPGEQLKDLAGRVDWGMVLTKSGRLVPYGTHRRKENSKWPEVRDSIEEQIGIVAIAAANDVGMALKEDGGVVAWNLSRSGSGLAIIPDEARNVVAIACGNNNFLALTAEGEVINWDHAGNLRSVPAFSSRPVAVRAQVGSSTRLSAAQLEDGSWVGWSDRPENEELVRQINQIGPALDLAFLGAMAEGDGGHLLWIEPAANKSTDISGPRIDLPPALAAMNQRGGTLEHWATGDWKDIDFSSAEGADDFVSIDTASEIWLASRATGERASNFGSATQFPRADEVIAVYRTRAVLKTGEIVNFFGGNPIVHPGDGVDISGLELGVYLELKRDYTLQLHGIDNERAKGFRENIAPFLSSIKDVKKLASGGQCGAVLRKTGGVIAWTLNDLLTPPADLPSTIVDIACGYGHVVALDAEGQVYTWGRNYEGQCNVPTDLPMGVRVRAGSYISAVQLSDGSWKAWGDNSLGIVDQINKLGPAIDVGFAGYQGNEKAVEKGVLLWIKPVIEKSRTTSPKASTKLPPALAAIKKRGGSLKGWISDGELDLTKAKSLDDFISLDGFPSEDHGFRWLGIRSNGTSVANLSDFERGADLVSLGSHYGVLQTGELLHCYHASRKIDPEIKDAVDAEIQEGSLNCSLVLQRDGSLKLIGNEWAIPELAKVREQLEHLTDVVKIEQSHHHSIVLRANGEVIAWSGYDLLPPDRPLLNIVDVAAGSGFMALDVDGKVHVWAEQLGPDSVVPADLGNAFAVRATGGVWAAQMEDGSWRAWGGKGTRETIEQINSIGPAVDILPGGHNAGPETLLWIDPAAENSAPRSALVVPSIELPPTLAAMNERGGRLRAWGHSPGREISVSKSYAVLDDFISVSGNTQGHFAAIRRNGTSACNFSPSFHSVPAAKQIDITHPSFNLGVALDGHVFGGDNLAALGTDISGVAKIACGNGLAYLVKNDGSLRLYWSKNASNLQNNLDELKSLKAEVESLQNIIDVDAKDVSAIALSDKGTVNSWHLGIGFVEPPAKAVEIVSIACGSGHFVALTREGKVITWGPEKIETKIHEAPPNLGKAVAIRAERYLAAAQMEDGSWVAWRSRLLKNEDPAETKHNNELIEQINSLGPAVDISFVADTGSSVLYWIEPADRVEARLKIEIPPALAAIKKRGGTLKSWTNDNSDMLNVSLADGISDFTSLDGVLVADAGYRWLGVRAKGRNITNLSGITEELISLHSHYAVLRGGRLIQCYHDSRKVEPETAGLIDAEVQGGSAKGAILLKEDGSLELFGSGWLNPQFSNIKSRIEGLTDVIKIAHSHSHSILLRKNGEVISWRRYDLLDGGRSLENIVDIAAGIFLAALDGEGKVHVWGSEESLDFQPPPDLGPAVAIRAASAILAAQMENGKWRAWGSRYSDTKDTIDQIIKSDRLWTSCFLPTEKTKQRRLFYGLSRRATVPDLVERSRCTFPALIDRCFAKVNRLGNLFYGEPAL